MCELLGLCFAKPIGASLTLREFGQRARDNADGWGLAWYPDRSAAVVKEPIGWGQTKLPGFLETYPDLSSAIYIAHVRHRTTGGPPTHADTHPFVRELRGRDYCFAHNGTLKIPPEELNLKRYAPVGATDSERAFCLIMQKIADGPGQLTTEDSWRWLHDQLFSLNRFGTANCLLADGQRLYCYRDQGGHKGLTLREVDIQRSEVHKFADDQVKLELAEETINHGLIAATNSLSATGWEPAKPGTLLVLENGIVRFTTG